MLIARTYLDIGNSVYFLIACIEINDFVDALNFKVKYRDYENVKKYRLDIKLAMSEHTM